MTTVLPVETAVIGGLIKCVRLFPSQVILVTLKYCNHLEKRWHPGQSKHISPAKEESARNKENIAKICHQALDNFFQRLTSF